MSHTSKRSEEDFRELLLQAASYYSEKYRQQGDSAQGMDWHDQASQYLRFERLIAHLDLLPESSMLDVGCGNAELLAFCRKRDVQTNYLGIDVSPEMVSASNRRFGEGTAILSSLTELVRQGRAFDFVVASGTFNVRQQTPVTAWRKFFHRSVEEMGELARRAVVFNIMSERVDYRYDHLYYAGVDEVAELSSRCGTRRFVIDHAYPLFEMTASFFFEEAA